MSDALIDTIVWAAAVVVIVCFAVCILRKPISGAIERLKIRYEKNGLSVDGSTPNNQTEPKTTEPGLNLPTATDRKEALRLESIKSFGMSPLVSQGDDAIRSAFNRL